MKVALSGGNSRSLTLDFVVGLAVLLVDFRNEKYQRLEFQSIGISCVFLRYFGHKVSSLPNSRDFLKGRKFTFD